MDTIRPQRGPDALAPKADPEKVKKATEAADKAVVELGQARTAWADADRRYRDSGAVDFLRDRNLRTARDQAATRWNQAARNAAEPLRGLNGPELGQALDTLRKNGGLEKMLQESPIDVRHQLVRRMDEANLPRQVDDFTAKSKVYFTSGIQSTQDLRTEAGQLTANLTGRDTQISNNNTYGTVTDLAECQAQLFKGRLNPPTEALARSLHTDLTARLKAANDPKAPKPDPPNLTVIGHSQGGIITTGAVREAISQLRKDGWKDDQIRDVVSKQMRVDLLGSPVNLLRDNGDALNQVPAQPGREKEAAEKGGPRDLSWFFGGRDAVRDVVWNGGTKLDQRGGPGFVQVRHSADPIAQRDWLNLNHEPHDREAIYMLALRNLMTGKP